jgi:hypothetical protein
MALELVCRAGCKCVLHNFTEPDPWDGSAGEVRPKTGPKRAKQQIIFLRWTQLIATEIDRVFETAPCRAGRDCGIGSTSSVMGAASGLGLVATLPALLPDRRTS